MKIVVIGGSGHAVSFLPEQHLPDRDFAAIAPGSAGEPVDGILATLTQAGYVPLVYTDYREMLRTEKPDVVMVDRYYSKQAGVVLDALAAGCHVLPDTGGADDRTSSRGRSFTEKEFDTYVELASATDNLEDNLRRAGLLGFGGKDIRIAPGAIVRMPAEQLGCDVFIGLYSYINGNVTIEDHVLIGPRCSLTAGHHKFDPATGCFSARTEDDYDNSIRIGCGSWLASNVTVTAGVKIGRANLICAGAVVTHDTPDYAIMAGLPAMQIGRIDPLTGEYLWFKKKGDQDG